LSTALFSSLEEQVDEEKEKVKNWLSIKNLKKKRMAARE